MLGYLLAGLGGAAVLLAGCLVGVSAATRHWVAGERRRAALATRPVCGCGHHASFHDRNGCHHQRVVDAYHVERVRCGCVRYLGPPPPPEAEETGAEATGDG